MKKLMEVINRPLTYATRRMMPGDTFLAKEREARILAYAKRARPTRSPVDLPPPPPEITSLFDHDGDGSPGGSLPAADRALDALRAHAEGFGIAVDRRWGERRLRSEIAKAARS